MVERREDQAGYRPQETRSEVRFRLTRMTPQNRTGHRPNPLYSNTCGGTGCENANGLAGMRW